MVLYEKARKTRSSSNESGGYLTINEALDALGPEVVERHKGVARRLNGFDSEIDYEAGSFEGCLW